MDGTESGSLGGAEEDERPECKRDEFICLIALPYDSEAIDRAEDAGEAGAVWITLSRKNEEGNLKNVGKLTIYPSQRLRRCRAFS